MADQRTITTQPFVVYYRRNDGAEFRGKYRFYGRERAAIHARRQVRSSRLAGFRVVDEREP